MAYWSLVLVWGEFDGSVDCENRFSWLLGDRAKQALASFKGICPFSVEISIEGLAGQLNCLF